MPPTASLACAAPSLDAGKLKSYLDLAKASDPQTADAMGSLITMVEMHLDRPKASAKANAPASTPHPSGIGVIEPLPEEEVKRLWDVVPWEEELEMYGKIFDRISPETNKPLRDAAFHLLWYGRELFLDREPITQDRIKSRA
jgi:hypothetical protein